MEEDGSIGYTVPAVPGTISRKRGIILHISEDYEHERILPYQTEEACPISSCNKPASQCVNVSAPVTLTPTAVIGSLSVACQGIPEVTCVTGTDGSRCTLMITQRVCVSVPVRFGVEMDSDDPTIACADSRCTACGD